MCPCPMILLLLLSLPSYGASLIDAQFKLTRATWGAATHRQEVGVLYKNLLARSISSRCRWFPSDSQYMNIVSRKCGSARGTLFAFARFMTEADAFRLGDGAVNDHNHTRFVDFKDDCEFF